MRLFARYIPSMAAAAACLAAAALTVAFCSPEPAMAQSAKIQWSPNPGVGPWNYVTPATPLPVTGSFTCSACTVTTSAVAPFIATPRGFQQVSIGASALGFTPPASAAWCYIQTEVQAVRFRTDGTNPTAAIGAPLATGSQMLLSIAALTAAKFIAQTGTATLDVDCYS